MPEPFPSFREFFRASQVRAALGIEPLLPLLQHESAERRRWAATALGLCGEPAAAAPLQAALSDPDPTVAAAAATALQNLRARDACDALAVLARQADPVAAVAAIGAMAALGCPAAGSAAVERLGMESERNPAAARRILAELHGVRAPAVELAAVALLGHAHREVRLEAALRAAECDRVEAVPVLVAALSHPSPEVRDAAECALAAVAPLHRHSWAAGLSCGTAAAAYAAWRAAGGHLYFQSVG